MYSLDGEVVSRGFAYYNRNIDLSKVQRGTYIFSFKDEKGVLQKIRIVR
ncbi:T9SS type A sorting domain-containing protein [Chryseobacterium sp.]